MPKTVRIEMEPRLYYLLLQLLGAHTEGAISITTRDERGRWGGAVIPQRDKFALPAFEQAGRKEGLY